MDSLPLLITRRLWCMWCRCCVWRMERKVLWLWLVVRLCLLLLLLLLRLLPLQLLLRQLLMLGLLVR